METEYRVHEKKKKEKKRKEKRKFSHQGALRISPARSVRQLT